ncbi:A-kinase anchor protein 9-like [Parambassis ranga]|uniref:A-kinase anchor protein 9-like n=1 Tax=Parambassis ranga TaxID=210632 RepID=A0A6P7HJA6_9TELE|nr:A-kinase anchor protein 9-like [Parambassis ranga]
MAGKESEFERCLDELENTKTALESCKSEIESCKLQLENEQKELESCKSELATSRQKERMSSNEIMQLMGTVEELQKRCHRGSLSESDTIQKMEVETVRKLELLRAELDEMYGQQIVQMKQELNLQHSERMQQLTEQHQAEMELLKVQQLSQSSTSSSAEVETLNAKVGELQEMLAQSQAMQDRARYELHRVVQEKTTLQAKVENLLQELNIAKEKVEQVSQSLITQERKQGELQQLQETIDNLRSELSAAQEAAQEAETKHESETTNYKIKLEMLEREKDAVLDRMAESQEAELERLRTQLLFSHEEELTQLKEDLQRENFLNTENLLNEAAIKHEKVLDELRSGYEEELRLLQREKTSFSAERDELLHQIFGLKEDLKLALHSSKADELVQQLQELQVELEELRKGGEERARMEREIQTLLKKTEILENQTKEKDNKLREHELAKETLVESNNTLKEELDSHVMKIETLTAENSQMQQQVVQLREEVEKQRTTFSFAEKNFEVNYQELKEEYTCLIEAKTQLEDRTLKETLEFEAKISGLQLQIRELEDSRRDIKTEDLNTNSKAVVEKDSNELMEKLNVTLNEKESLAGRLSEVTEQLMSTESKVGQLEEELMKLRQENAKVIAQSESLGKELEKKQEIIREQMRGQDAQRKAKLREEEQAVETVCSWRILTFRFNLYKRKRAGKEDSTDGYQGDGGRDYISKGGECRLQMEAQRISLSQLHAAQMELLQEETHVRTHSLELKLQSLKDHSDQDEQKVFKYQSLIQAVSEECSEIILSCTEIFSRLPLSPSTSKDPEERPASVNLQRLRAEAQEKQHQLEESHRQEMEHLRAHYQQQATETEERYATELFVLQQRLQEVTGNETHYSLSSVAESSSERWRSTRRAKGPK